MNKPFRPAEEQSANELNELPAKLAKPAQRALARAGITRLNQLSKITELGKLLQDKDAVKAQRVMGAMLQMSKIDIKALQQAYEQQ